MAKFGFFSKALAGAGQGLQVAGQLGFHAKLQGDLEAQRAELLAKRDEVLQRYEGGREDRRIASAEKISGQEIAARKEVGLSAAKATTYAADVGRTTELEKQTKEHQFKRSEPFKGDNGVYYQFALDKESNIIMENGKPKIFELGKPGEKWQAVPDAGVMVEERTGKQKKLSAEPGFMTKGQRDEEESVMKRLNMLKDLARSRMGVDFFEKLNNNERVQFDAIFIDAAKNSRTMPNIEDAYESAIEKWNKRKEIADKAGDSDENTKTNDILDKHGVPKKR